MTRCRICNRRLSDVEQEYYVNICEDCEEVFTEYMKTEERHPWWLFYVKGYWKRFVTFIRKGMRR